MRNKPWDTPVGPIEVVPGVTLEAQLEDMQGRFNLNWLVTAAATNGVPNGAGNTPLPGTPLGNSNSNSPTPGAAVPGQPNPQAVAAFRKLLELSSVDPKWADMVVDWIDSDNQPQTQGAEDSAYMGQNPPYLAANQYITSTTELLALPGFGRENYQKIAPYIAALPPSVDIEYLHSQGTGAGCLYSGGRVHRVGRRSKPREKPGRRSAAGLLSGRQGLLRQFRVEGGTAQTPACSPILHLFPAIQSGHNWQRRIQSVQSSLFG